MTTSNPVLSQFSDTFTVSPLNVNPNYFKNPNINFLLSNFKPSLMKTNVFETGISDHHKMISTIIKLHITRESPKKNTTETTRNLLPVTLVLNYLAKEEEE